MKKSMKVWSLIVILAVVGCEAVTMASAGLWIIPDYPELREVNHNIKGIGYNSASVMLDDENKDKVPVTVVASSVVPAELIKSIYSAKNGHRESFCGYSHENERMNNDLRSFSPNFLNEETNVKERITSEQTLPDSYEPDDTYTQANWISTSGTKQTHNFHVAGDHDWVKFNANENINYLIDTSDLGSESDTYIYLYDTDGTTEITHDDDGGIGLASRIVWKCSDSGTYYIMARHYSSSACGPDTYYNISVLGGYVSPAEFNGVYFDYCEDTNGDGKYNYLAIDVGVDVKKSGKYRVGGRLTDNSTGDEIEWTSTDRILDVGMQNFTLRFNGYQIYRHGTSGKFDLRDLRVYDKDWNTLDYRDYAYTTLYYSFTDFDKPPIDLTDSYSDSGVDSDGDGKYNHLAIDVWVSVKEAGRYNLRGWLYDSEDGYIGYDYDGAYLNKGLQSFTLEFNGYDIYRNGVDGPFTLNLELNDEDWNMIDYKEDAYTTSYYSFADFDKPPADLADSYSDYGIDADEDGKYDYLGIDVWINVKEAGYYSISGWLDDSYGQGVSYDGNGSYLDVGLQKLTLKFNGYEIYRNGVSGSFSLDHVRLYDDWGMVDDKYDAYDTSYYSYTDFDVPPIYLTDAYSDYGIDTDGDGKYDYLAIDVGVNVIEDGTYEVYGCLHDSEDQYITSDWDEVDLSTGLQKFALKFDGYEIYRNGVDGPFLLDYIEIEDDWNRIDYKYDAYVTSYYSYTEFQKTPAEFTGNFSDYGLDTDGDGLYNYLVIEAEINVTKSGDFEFWDDLYYYNETTSYWEYGVDCDWHNYSYLDPGIHNLTIKLSGIEIHNPRYNGTFKIKLYLDGEVSGEWLQIDDYEYYTKSYNYTEFQIPPAEFNDVYSDYGQDRDGDGLYDYLVVDVGVNVIEAGEYEVSGELYEIVTHNYVDSAYSTSYLNEGSQTVQLKFEGIKIRQNEYNGTYDLKSLYLYNYSSPPVPSPVTPTPPPISVLVSQHESKSAKAESISIGYGEQLDYRYYAFTTSYYNYTEFEESTPDAYEPDDKPSLANYISVDGTKQTHDFHVPDDRDWLKFNATEGNSYTIETSELGTESDTYLYLYDSDRTTEIYHDDDSGIGLASKIIWNCSISGTYYVMVRHYSFSAFGPETRYNVSVTIKNTPPIASFTYSPEKPVVNETIIFDATSSFDLDGEIISYEWDFGDGNITNTTEEIIIHSYAFAGIYNVALTVTDNDELTNSTTKTIKVWEPLTLGKGIWIWKLSEAEGGNVSAIIERCKNAGIEWVAIKCGDGRCFWTQCEPSTIEQFQNAGINVLGWQYVYGEHGAGDYGTGGDPVEEAEVANQILDSGVDGFIIDAEGEYEGKPDNATIYLEKIRAEHPYRFIAYTTFPIIDYHTDFPYLEFGKYCDAVMPQDYWKEIGVPPEEMIDWMEEQWDKWHEIWEEGGYSDSIKPIIPLGQGWDVSGSEITRFCNLVYEHGYGGVSLWRYGTMSEENWEAYAECFAPKPSVEITTDKYEYTAGETMHIDITLANPTEELQPVYFAWRLDLPDSGEQYWITVIPLDLAPGYEQTFPIPWELGNYGFSFSASWYVALYNTTTLEVISEDTADWRYVPSEMAKGEIMPEEIAKDVEAKLTVINETFTQK